MEIGHVIARLRNEKEISQRKLATDLNVSSSVVGLWESNKRLPSLECFISLIDYFAVSADLLLENDRKISPVEYQSAVKITPETKKILDTFELLNDDNKDILIGEAKKTLKNQRIEEKRESMPVAKAT
ncbi:MAG: helix-turn-helix transcriptional regulator [Lachnospiraceae bacterium]|nr:helix-turn-helix transcriptional regulator [Lachnospiraceae bacterium]